MDFSFGYSPWFLLLCLVGAGGFTYWTYRSTVPSLSTVWRGVLGSLRFVALALVLFLLFEPVYRQFQQSERPPTLAVVIDDSESIQLVTSDTAGPSAARARDSLRPIMESLALENGPGRARFFAYNRELRSLPNPSVDSLKFDGGQTDAGTALEAVRDEVQGENLRGVVLVSDGQNNTGRNPLRAADRYPVPIHTITVGDTTRRRDLRIRSIAANDRAYLNSSVPVRAFLATNSGGSESVSVTLERNGTIIDRQNVTLPEGAVDVPVDLTYEAQTTGFQQLTVRVTELSGEVTTRNNVQTVSLRVLESKRTVLLLGAAPSPNYTAVRRVYERDTNTEVIARVPSRDGSFLEAPLPEDLSNIDVVVCAGFPSSPVPGRIVGRIGTLVEEGTPAVFFLDHQTDLSAWAEHFDSVLPVSPSTQSTTFLEAGVALVESERQHPILRMEDNILDLIDQLPPLQVSSDEWTPSPDAQVLATARGTGVVSSAPLLVVRRRAGLRTAAFLGTRVWRWSLLPAEMEQADPIWPRLASNLLRWVSTEESGDPVQVQPVAPTFEGTETVELAGQVYDESMQPVPDATVEVTVTDSTGTEYPYTMEPVGEGRYRLEVGRLPQGPYEYRSTAQLGDATLGSDQGRFSVDQRRVEYQSTRADPVLMRQIATRSGGTAYTTKTAANLPQMLDRSSTFSSTVVERTSEAELWRTSIFLLIILLLLAGEWTLRKRFGLA